MERTINRNVNPIRQQNGLQQKSPRAVATNSKVKPKVFRPMTKVEREIWKLQISTKLLASQRALKECIKMYWLISRTGQANFPIALERTLLKVYCRLLSIFNSSIYGLCARDGTRKAQDSDGWRPDSSFSCTRLRSSCAEGLVRETFSGAQRNNTNDREVGRRFSLYWLWC